MACYNCTQGKYNVLDLLTGLTSGPCKYCTKGYEYVSPQEKCTECIAGKYQDQSEVGTGKTQTCKNCLVGLASVKAADSCSYTPKTCPPGTASNSVECNDCVGGKFTAIEGSTECKYCALGTEFTSSKTSCTWCDAGMFQNQTAQAFAKCQTCVAGTSSVQNTKEHYTCEYNSTSCPPGTYHDSSGNACVACEIGKLRVHAGATSSSDCITCTPGFEYVDTISACTACEKGQYQEDGTLYGPKCKTCEKGQAAMDSLTSCAPCAEGKYQDGVVSTKQWGCSFCAVGHGFVTSSEICVACEKGQYQPRSDVVSAKCIDCEDGQFTIKSESTKCLYCKPGYEFTTRDTLCSRCVDTTVQDNNATAGAVCKSCPAGFAFVNVDERCSTCPPGQWNLLGGLETVEGCLTCDEGRSSQHWREPCTDCKTGLYQEDNISSVWGCKHCPSGREYIDVNHSCTACDSGRYQSESAGYSSECMNCAKGKEFVSTIVVCQLCGNGTYQYWNDKPNVKCLTCPKGRDAPNNKQPCESCRSGKYQPLAKSITYGCTYCHGFEKSIERVPGAPAFPPDMFDLQIWTDWSEVGNFSEPGASYCPYFTLQSGRCDEWSGGVYILENETCQKGAAAVGWNRNTKESMPWPWSTEGKIFPNDFKKYPLGCFDTDYDFVNQYLYLDNNFHGPVGTKQHQMDATNDCNLDSNVKEYGRCICETCGPGKYKAKMACGENGECVLAEDFPGPIDKTGKPKYKSYYYTVYKCLTCNYGQYQDEVGRHNCKTCRNGTYQDNNWHDPPIQIVTTISTSQGIWKPESQVISCQATSGDFKLEFNGQVITEALAWNATPVDVIKALQALPNVVKVETHQDTSTTSLCSAKTSHTAYIFESVTEFTGDLPMLIIRDYTISLNTITRITISTAKAGERAAGDFALKVTNRAYSKGKSVTITSDGIQAYNLYDIFVTEFGATNVAIKTIPRTDNGVTYDIIWLGAEADKDVQVVVVSDNCADPIQCNQASSTGTSADLANIIVTEISPGGTPGFTISEQQKGQAPLSGTFSLTLDDKKSGGTVANVQFDETAATLATKIFNNFQDINSGTSVNVDVTRSGPTRGLGYQWTITFTDVVDEIPSMTINIDNLRGDAKSWSTTRIVKGGTSPIIACKTCPSGYVSKFPVSSTCVSCESGKKYVAIDEPCLNCQSGLYQEHPSLSAVETVCENCEPHLHKSDRPKSCKTCVEHSLHPFVACKTCRIGRAPPDDRTKCEKCLVGRYQELAKANVWGCKTCPTGYQHVGEKISCDTCKQGLYQDSNDAVGVACKSCSFGKDAPNKHTACANCATGRFQDLEVSVTYGCSEIITECEEGDGMSLTDGQDVEPGMMTIRLFEGTCCSGVPLSTENLHLDRCMLSNTGSVWVRFPPPRSFVVGSLLLYSVL